MNLPHLLRLYQLPGDEHLADCLAHLLAAHRAPGFAEVALRNLRPKLQIVVTKPGAKNPGWIESSRSALANGPPLRKLSGFPPVSRYFVEWDPKPWEFRLTSERKRAAEWRGTGGGLRYRREQVDEYWINREPRQFPGARRPVSTGVLASLLRTAPEKVPLKGRYVCHVPWSGRADRDRRVAAMRKRIRGDFQALKHRLVQLDLLTAKQAGSIELQSPNYDVDLRGRRK